MMAVMIVTYLNPITTNWLTGTGFFDKLMLNDIYIRQ